MNFGAFIDAAEAEKLLCDLVAIDSTCPGLVPGGAGELKIAEYIAGWMTQAGFPAEVQRLGGTRANVVGWLKGSGAPGGRRLMLNGHLDTVGAEGMTIAPFTPKVEGNKLYGRGACDMKAGLASALLAMQAVRRAGVKLKGEVIFTGAADEEFLSVGTEEIARRCKADGAIVCEPSGGTIGVTHKGFVWLEAEIFGRAAHGSDPAAGVDAIVQAAKFLVAADEFEKKVLWKRPHHRLLTPPSLHAALIEGGKELSTYPDYCKVSLERRTVPGETAAGVKAEIEAIIAVLAAADPDFRAKCTVTFERQPLEFRPDSPVLGALALAHMAVTGREPEMMGGSGWCDTAILQAAGIPAVIYGPAGEGAHAAVEYACLDSVVEAAGVLARLAADFCGVEEE